MSDYDLETTNAMLLKGRYLYVGSCAIKQERKFSKHIGLIA